MEPEQADANAELAISGEKGALTALNEDELLDLLAFGWLSRGDFAARAWRLPGRGTVATRGSLEEFEINRL